MLQFVSDWTIAELTERCAEALADRDAPDSGRIRAVPDERAIRYYTTLGLLDRPTLRGRTALYGRRHLAQLVAIKREQARGATLAEIQRTLPTLDDAALAALAGVEVVPAPRPTGRAEFWRARPATPSPASPASPSPVPAAAASALALRVELELGGGLRLSLTPDRPLTDADVAALHAAAAPLIAELARRHLVTPPESSP
ncbi:MAG: MerR family transcriptional regulator [Myxococcales bacterium]|nr:MerR family transcriptional regulator [Myxococcales bacterium]MBK7197755.1 MerR family transcriptional regulator [Myxococcales bacterium]MBP6844409.1 MerR family transcriptional regulator [Kofleriaceae bacterium]